MGDADVDLHVAIAFPSEVGEKGHVGHLDMGGHHLSAEAGRCRDRETDQRNPQAEPTIGSQYGQTVPLPTPAISVDIVERKKANGSGRLAVVNGYDLYGVRRIVTTVTIVTDEQALLIDEDGTTDVVMTRDAGVVGNDEA